MNQRDAATNGTATPSLTRQSFDALSLRGWLAHLSATGRVATIAKPVALKHELAAVAKRLDGKQAAVFLAPDGHDMPVVSGFMSRRAWIAEAMGVPEKDLLQRFRDAADHPLPWKEVPAGEAACQQVVHTSGIDLHALLPIPTHSEHDSGPYITAGLVIARNPAPACRTCRSTVSRFTLAIAWRFCCCRAICTRSRKPRKPRAMRSILPWQSASIR